MILQENGTRFCTEGKVFTIGGRHGHGDPQR